MGLNIFIYLFFDKFIANREQCYATACLQCYAINKVSLTH